MHRVYLSIGGNLGNKRKNFKNVYSLIGERLGTIMERSSLFETSPWGFESDDNFWNQVLLVETPLGPEVLLAGIRETEGFFHRQREPGRYLSREMDIDMLYFDDIVMDSET